jgi:hypothetical protein
MTSNARAAISWLLAGCAAVPIAGPLHELAHLLAYHAAGMPEVVLHFNTVSGASPDHPGWALAAGAAAGPVMTLAIVAACIVGVWRLGPKPGLIAMGLVAPFRTFVPASWLVIHTLWGKANDANFDELNAARAAGWPPQPFMLLEVALVVAAIWWLVRAMPLDQRRMNVAAVAIGGGLGIAVYWTLGPLVLP